MSEHNEDCDVNDVNPEGIKKPCNCGADKPDIVDRLEDFNLDRIPLTMYDAKMEIFRLRAELQEERGRVKILTKAMEEISGLADDESGYTLEGELARETLDKIASIEPPQKEWEGK